MTPPNVLLITIDSLCYDRLLEHGQSINPAPNIFELATSGTSFASAFANGPNTPTSFPSILTSTYPLFYGGYRYLSEHRPFISKVLSDSGFTCVGYHSNPHLGPEKNYNHGFSNFNDGEESDDDVRTVKNFVDNRFDPNSRLYRLLRRIYHYVSMRTDSSAYVKAPKITDRAINWLSDDWDNETPFFMWVHYMDVHYPFKPPDRFMEELGFDPLSARRAANLNGKMQEEPDALTKIDQQDLLNLYHGEIRFVDYNLGRLFEHLGALDTREDTVIIVTADHGEAFGEHGRYGHHPKMYDELLHVPLVINAPGVSTRTVKNQVSLIDIGPTIYDLVEVETPEAVQGASLVPFLTGNNEKEDGRRVIGASRDGNRLAVRTPEWKCLWNRKAEAVELYHLRDDPDEQHDVSSDNPQIVEQFKRLLKNHVAEARATDTDLPEVEESEEVKQRLEDLGYVD